MIREMFPWLGFFGIVLLVMIGCGDDESLVYSLDIDGPYDVEGSSRRPKVGFRAILTVTAYNSTDDPFDILSGAEIYKNIEWKSSNESVAKLSLDRSVLESIQDPELIANLDRVVIIEYKRPGQVVITASYKGSTDALTLEIE
jgi:hypothetical protein